MISETEMGLDHLCDGNENFLALEKYSFCLRFLSGNSFCSIDSCLLYYVSWLSQKNRVFSNKDYKVTVGTWTRTVLLNISTEGVTFVFQGVCIYFCGDCSGIRVISEFFHCPNVFIQCICFGLMISLKKY